MKSKILAAALTFSMSAVAGCLASSSGSGSNVGPKAAEPVLAIVGATVLPMTDPEAVLRDHTVVVRGERIEAVGPRSSIAIPAGARVIDGRGRWLMPGLQDMHVHLEHVEDPDILKLFVAHGVTTVRNMDGRPFILDWRRRVASGALLGPRIVTAGPIIDGAPPARDDNLAVADAVAASRAVEAQAAAGYDFIKTYANLSPGAYQAILAAAQARGLRVAGHVPRGVSLQAAADAQWSLEHLGDFATAVTRDGAVAPGWARRGLAAPFDAAKAAALARSLAASQAWVVPTSIEQDRALAPDEAVAAWMAEPEMRDIPAATLSLWRGRLARFTSRMDADDFALAAGARLHRLALIKAMNGAGVRLVVGSDTPNAFIVPGQSVHLELANFVAAGLSPGQALFAATGEPDRMLGELGGAGTISSGRRADLLLLSADPLVDVRNARARVGLVLAGRWMEETELMELRRHLVGTASGRSQRPLPPADVTPATSLP